MRKSAYILLILVIAWAGLGASAQKYSYNYVDARAYGSLEETVAAMGTLSRTVVVTNDQTLSAPLTIPSNINLEIVKGGTIDGAYTLTINGAFFAGNYTVFGSSVTVTFGSGSVDFVYPEWRGIDGTADEVQINWALNRGKPVKLTGTSYSIAGPIIVPGNSRLSGLGAESTTITTSANTFNAIEIASDARRVVLEDLKLSSTIGADNAAIRANLTNGGAEHHYRNITIDTFKYGLHVAQLWWNNTVENVRWNLCDYSVYSSGLGGADNINNLFVRCYSNGAVTCGVYLNRFKNTMFLQCNFGGTATGNAEYVTLISSNYAIKFVGCNFESNTRTSGYGHITAWSTTTVLFDSCTFVSNAGLAGAGAYMLHARDTALIQVINCEYMDAGANMVAFYVQNSGSIVQLDALINQHVYGTSTMRSSRVMNYFAPFKGTTANRPTLYGEDTGVIYLDTTLTPTHGQPIIWNGSAWHTFIGTLDSIAGAPTFTGQFAVTGGNAYIATGITATTDWKQIN